MKFAREDIDRQRLERRYNRFYGWAGGIFLCLALAAGVTLRYDLGPVVLQPVFGGLALTLLLVILGSMLGHRALAGELGGFEPAGSGALVAFIAGISIIM